MFSFPGFKAWILLTHHSGICSNTCIYPLGDWLDFKAPIVTPTIPKLLYLT